MTNTRGIIQAMYIPSDLNTTRKEDSKQKHDTEVVKGRKNNTLIKLKKFSWDERLCNLKKVLI